ncbi:hypothetical protein WR25_16113 [Diploscapter pachys]|uniref:Aminopeptidase n=1 Tax=Diploscapter pachys TaxID=2018661 RepID=A0A2A2LBC7_9BILA|nr:hypothetical protein WR25_16113 [Diploscapter pachys]
MPAKPSVKLLYDDPATDSGREHSPWSQSRKSRRGRCTFRCGVCVAILAGVLAFLLGLTLGALIHAMVFPDLDSRLSLGFFDDVDSDNETMNATKELDDSSESQSSSENEDHLIEVKAKSKNSKEDNDEKYSCGSEFPWNSLRLPRSLTPVSYNLTLHPNITTQKLDGSVAITIKVSQSTNLIILHASELDMIDAKILNNGDSINAEFSECEHSQEWAWTMEKEVDEGDEIELSIEYTGTLMPDLQGLYINTHVKPDGSKSLSAITQLEATYAREMFPCFDEPNFKATFEVSVVREADHVTRSNTNLRISREHVDGLYIDVFERTLKMSTYLLAVAVLEDYDFVKRTTKKTDNVIEVRIYAPEDSIVGQAEFALDTTVRALEYFENYFNISYPLDKLDVIALDDMSEGAMENWGMVTFRGSLLLYDENTTDPMLKETIALIICHEIAHQWFGNLVTMDSWEQLYLNEGFANYLEFQCVDELYPDWDIMSVFYGTNVAYAQESDGLTGARPVSGDDEAEPRIDIMGLFDAISYSKSSAVIRMIQELVGERGFQKALIEYLNKYQYSNAKGSQLWKIVEKQANLPDGLSIQKLTDAYISQPGYPVIHVSLNTPSEAVVHNQTRFLFKNNDGEDSEEDDNKELLWPVPLHYKTDADDEVKLQWIKATKKRVTFELEEPANWIIANTGGVGYVKVMYDKRIYGELTKQLQENHHEISAVDRVMLLVDAFDLAKSSELDIDIYLDLIEYAMHEHDRMVWTIISQQLFYIETMIEDTTFVHLFKDLERSLALRVYEKRGWEYNANSLADKGLKTQIIKLACRLRHRDCMKQAISRYNEWVKRDQIADPEVHVVALEEGVKQGNVQTWEKMWEVYEDTSSPSAKVQYINAMAASQDPALTNRLLRLCIDGKIKPNFIPRVFDAVSETTIGRNVAWRFFKTNYERFKKIMGDGTSMMTSCIRQLSTKLSTTEDLNELRQFVRDKKIDQNNLRIKEIFETIEINIQWRRLNEDNLSKWLETWDERRRDLGRRKRA